MTIPSSGAIASELRRLRGEFDLILLDTPPHAESDARAAVREADLVLVPCQPSALDVWASAPTLELAQGSGSDALREASDRQPSTEANGREPSMDYRSGSDLGQQARTFLSSLLTYLRTRSPDHWLFFAVGVIVGLLIS